MTKARQARCNFVTTDAILSSRALSSLKTYKGANRLSWGNRYYFLIYRLWILYENLRASKLIFISENADVQKNFADAFFDGARPHRVRVRTDKLKSAKKERNRQTRYNSHFPYTVREIYPAARDSRNSLCEHERSRRDRGTELTANAANVISTILRTPPTLIENQFSVKLVRSLFLVRLDAANVAGYFRIELGNHRCHGCLD